MGIRKVVVGLYKSIQDNLTLMYRRLETNVHVPVVDKSPESDVSPGCRCHDAIRHTRTSSTSSTYRPNYVANSPRGQQLSIPLVSWNVYTSFQKLSESDQTIQRLRLQIIMRTKGELIYVIRLLILTLAYNSHASNEYSSWNIIYIISEGSNCL